MARRKRRSPRRRRNQPIGMGTLLLLGAGALLFFGRKATAAPVAPQSLPPANGTGVPRPDALDPSIPDELTGTGAPDAWSATVPEINAAQARITDFGQSIAPDVIDELIMGGTIPPDAFDAFADPGLLRPIRLMPGVYAVPLALVQAIAPMDAPVVDPFEGGEWF